MKKFTILKIFFAINFHYNQTFLRLYVLLFLQQLSLWIKLYLPNTICIAILYIYTCMYIYTYLHQCTYVCTNTCAHVRTHAYTHACIYTFVYMYLYKCTYICIYTFLHSAYVISWQKDLHVSRANRIHKKSRGSCVLHVRLCKIPRDAPDCLNSPNFAPSERNWHTANEARCNLKYIANLRLFKKAHHLI